MYKWTRECYRKSIRWVEKKMLCGLEKQRKELLAVAPNRISVPDDCMHVCLWWKWWRSSKVLHISELPLIKTSELSANERNAKQKWQKLARNQLAGRIFLVQSNRMEADSLAIAFSGHGLVYTQCAPSRRVIRVALLHEATLSTAIRLS